MEPADQTPPPVTRPPVSPLVFVTAVLRRRWMFFWMVGAGIIGVTAYTLLHGRTYTSTLIFLPQTGANALSGFAGVAAQFGVAVPSGAPDQTPQFYSAFLGTGPVQEDLVNSSFRAVVGKSADGRTDSVVTQPLIDWLEIDPDQSVGKRQTLAILRLPKILTVIPDVQTSLVTVTVTTPIPDLSKAIADRVLELINQFNGVRRNSDAAAERHFVEGRLSLARDSLRMAEDRVRRFLEQNRTFASSPTLMLEHDRLQREMEFEQQVVATLMQSVEQARINEVRNTPVVTVVERPEVALTPDRYRLLLKWVLMTMAISLVGVVIVVLTVVLQLEEAHEPDVSEGLRNAWAATLADQRRLLGPAHRLWQRVRQGRR